MLTRFNRMVLRMLPGPFFGWLAALMFLLVLQFLIKHMPDLVGKGLPLQVILELMTYSLAYMVVLAVPMSVLIATLIVFGRLAEIAGDLTARFPHAAIEPEVPAGLALNAFSTSTPASFHSALMSSPLRVALASTLSASRMGATASSRLMTAGPARVGRPS